ncbi:MAG: TolC family protein [Planctomycetaceae bacterium]|nr:TolC family protein [Planctomycetaceae bacterium]
MNGRQRIQQFIVGILIAGVLGCGPAHPVYLGSKGQIDKHYIKNATRIEYPDTHVETSQEVLGAMEPFTVANPDIPREAYDLSLEEAICTTMQNSRILRTLSGVGFSSSGIQGVPQALLSAPNSVATTYDVALVESDPRYGVEAALSAFDAQLKSSLGWSYEDRGDLNRLMAPTNDLGTFQTSIQKTAASGGTYFVTNGNNYYAGNGNSRYNPPYWAAYLEGGFSQPLLQGRGVQFNRIAGPGAIPGFSNGVSVARINTDMTLADFEMATRNLVYDVERAYWNLYYAYHYLESVKAGYTSAQTTWNFVNTRLEAGGAGGTAQAETQARNQLFLFRSRAEQAQNNLFKAERTLRYIMGISPTDGRFFRPSSEPTLAPLKLDWRDLLTEALARSPELRKQKWDVKKKELELLASKNFLLPRLDLNASYRWNGVGAEWINDTDSAYRSITHDKYQDWQAGFSFSTPIGKRKEMAAVRNATLSLARSQSILQQQEFELAHQISDSYGEVAKYYQLSETGLQRRIASEMEVQTVTNAYNAGTTTVDYVLDAQRRKAEAETEFYDNVVQYNLAIAELHRRKGTLLEYNNVYLAEGPWPNKAYIDAREQARKRDAGHYMNYGYTRPQVFSRGEYQQFQGLDATEGQNWMHYDDQPYLRPDLQPTLPVQQLMPEEEVEIEDAVIETDPLTLNKKNSIQSVSVQNRTKGTNSQAVYSQPVASSRSYFGDAPTPQAASRQSNTLLPKASRY